MEPQINDDDLSPVEENNTEEDNSMILQRHAPWVARPAVTILHFAISRFFTANLAFSYLFFFCVSKSKQSHL
jgi:hypothetical protein